ncbi:MAG: DUF3090 domain-containing protein [Phototrophicales bacterium]
MAAEELELNPVDFITIGTVGPKGKRVFYLQAASGDQLVSLIIEKEQSWALSEAIRELIDDIEKRLGDYPPTIQMDMELRDPIEPLFRISQMGLGYDEDLDKVVLVAQALRVPDADNPLLNPQDDTPDIVRMWCSRAQMRALSEHTITVVRSGRADPKQNGRLVYYWT